MSPRALRYPTPLVAAMFIVIALGGFALTLSMTAATFSDSEQLGPNVVTAGTLDLSLGENREAFEVTNMAPGDAASRAIEVLNTGDLPLSLDLRIEVDGGGLAPYLRARVSLLDDCPLMMLEPDSAPALTDIETSADTVGNLALAPGDSATVCLQVMLPAATPNAAQGTQANFVLYLDAEHDLSTTTTEPT